MTNEELNRRIKEQAIRNAKPGFKKQRRSSRLLNVMRTARTPFINIWGDVYCEKLQ